MFTNNENFETLNLLGKGATFHTARKYWNEISLNWINGVNSFARTRSILSLLSFYKGLVFDFFKKWVMPPNNLSSQYIVLSGLEKNVLKIFHAQN